MQIPRLPCFHLGYCALPLALQSFPSFSKPFLFCFRDDSLSRLFSQLSACSSSTSFTSSSFSACAFCVHCSGFSCPRTCLVHHLLCFQLPITGATCKCSQRWGGRITRIFPLPEASSSSERLFVCFLLHTHTHTHTHDFSTDLEIFTF